jgi:hypothetical protein
MTMEDHGSILPTPKRTPWNKGKLIGGQTAAAGKARLVYTDEAGSLKMSGQSRHALPDSYRRFVP